MGTIHLLRASDPSERSEWRALLERWQHREVWAEPAYVELFAGTGEEACAVAWSQDGAVVLFPVVVRSLEALPWVGGQQGRDVVSPYGYGGPFFVAGRGSEGAGRAFWSDYDVWAEELRVVSTFARLSLFVSELAHPGQGVEEVAHNVIVDLTMRDEDLWMGYAHKVRKNVNRARRNGVVVAADPDGDRLEEFIEIYRHTMERRGAGSGYYFPREFFERIVRDLRGNYCFFHAFIGERMVSTELVLMCRRHVYSFLGGTRSQDFDQRPNDLLKHEIAVWAQRRGLVAFVLGGGYLPDDGIFQFKRSFSPNGVVPFSVLRRVHDQETLAELVVARREYERAHGCEWVPRTGFFPQYRA